MQKMVMYAFCNKTIKPRVEKFIETEREKEEKLWI
jgi:hypothetical protein